MPHKNIWVEYDAYWDEPEPGRLPWGEPEIDIECELETRLGEEHVQLNGSGTELLSFRRDVDWDVEGDVADMHEVMRQHPEVDYRIREPY